PANIVARAATCRHVRGQGRAGGVLFKKGRPRTRSFSSSSRPNQGRRGGGRPGGDVHSLTSRCRVRSTARARRSEVRGDPLLGIQGLPPDESLRLVSGRWRLRPEAYFHPFSATLLPGCNGGFRRPFEARA